jgi:hypothetical protein
VAFVTTAPEGSVTCPRKVPVVPGDCAGDWVDDWAGDCADAGAASPASIAGIRIAKVRFARTKTDKSFKRTPFLSRQITSLENMG